MESVGGDDDDVCTPLFKPNQYLAGLQVVERSRACTNYTSCCVGGTAVTVTT